MASLSLDTDSDLHLDLNGKEAYSKMSVLFSSFLFNL